MEPLDPPSGGWSSELPPARPGNSLEVLIDGACALPAMASQLEQAQSHVHITGWYFSPQFALVRDGEKSSPTRSLARLAVKRVDVRVLVRRVRRCHFFGRPGATCGR